MKFVDYKRWKHYTCVDLISFYSSWPCVAYMVTKNSFHFCGDAYMLHKSLLFLCFTQRDLENNSRPRRRYIYRYTSRKVSRALQYYLAKIYNARNHIYGENFTLKLCPCAQGMALGTRTNFQLEIPIGSTVSAIHKFRENILESSRNVSETTLRHITLYVPEIIYTVRALLCAVGRCTRYCPYHQGKIIGRGVITRVSRCYWYNLEKYGLIHNVYWYNRTIITIRHCWNVPYLAVFPVSDDTCHGKPQSHAQPTHLALIFTGWNNI